MAESYPFEISPHLTEYNVPIQNFIASKPEFTAFIASAFIFSTGHPSTTVQQNHDSYGGQWEGPGGSCEDTDATLLYSLAREVLEESGLHVSRVRDLVGTLKWERRGGRGTAIKYSFLVDVYEAGNTRDNENIDASVQVLAQDGWEGRVQLAPGEHQDYVWATEEEVRSAIAGKMENVKIKLDEEEQGFLRAFEIFHSLHPPSLPSLRN